MSSPVQGKRRMDTDVIKLIESKHEVIFKLKYSGLVSNIYHFMISFSGHNTRWS